MAVYLDIRKPLNLYDCNTISFEQYAAILKKVDPEALLGKALKKDICYKEKNRSYPPKDGCGIPPRVKIDYKPPKVKPLEHLPVIGNSKAEERAVYDILYEKRDLVRDVLMLQVLYEAMKEVKPDLSPLDWNHAVTDVTGYDGFIRGDTSEIGAFFPEQIKAVNNRKNFTLHSSIIVTCFQLSAISYRTNPALPIPYPVEVVLARGQPAIRRASIFNARTRYTDERVSVRGRFHAPARFHGHAAALQFVLPVPFSGQLKT